MSELLFKILIIEIVTIFPLLLFTTYNENIKKTNLLEENMLLSLSLLASQYLLIETLNLFNLPYFIIVSIIPCIIALLSRRYFITLIILTTLELFFYNYSFYALFFSITFILDFIILYIIYLKTSMSKKNFVRCFSVATLILFVLNFLFIKEKSMNIFLEHLYYASCFYISLNIGCILLLKIQNAIDYKKNLIKFEKEKELKNSLFKITHEIKNPIAVVKGYLDMFDADDQEKSKKYIKIIKGEIDRTLKLLSDFLLFTKVSVEKEVINFNDLLSETKELLLPSIKRKKLFYSFETEKNLYVSLDYDRIKQVILNVLKNAVEATNEKGTIRLKAYKDKNKLVVLVSDNGSGMDKKTLESITTPFYTTKQNGTGLGVCLSKEIVEAHGGKLLFDSSAGKGTTVKISLPLD